MNTRHLEIGDYVRNNNDLRIGKVIELSENEVTMLSFDNIEYRYNKDLIIPVLLDETGIESSINTCTRHHIKLDFSRRNRLKVSLFDSNGKIQITYYYPKPNYWHELQQIARRFDETELGYACYVKAENVM